MAAGARDARAADRDREGDSRCAPSIGTRPASSAATSSGAPSEAAAHLSAALDDDPTLERSAEALEELLQRSAGVEGAGALLSQAPQAARGGVARRRRRQERRSGCACGRRSARCASTSSASARARWRRSRWRSRFDRDNLERHKQLADLYVQAGPDRTSTSRSSSTSSSCAHEKNRVRLVSRAQAPVHPDGAARQVGAAVGSAQLPQEGRAGRPDQGRTPTSSSRSRSRGARCRTRCGRGCSTPTRIATSTRCSRCWRRCWRRRTAQPHKALGLNRKEALSIERSTHSYAKALKYVTHDAGRGAARGVRAAGSEGARCSSPTASTDARWCRCSRSARRSSARSGRSASRCSSWRGAAAHLRPERFVRFILPQPQQLGHIIDAAMALADVPADKTPTPTGEIGKTVMAMQRALHAAAARAGGGHRAQAARRRARKPEEAALKWLQATDLTAIRAGLRHDRRSRRPARAGGGRAAAGDRAAGDAAPARPGLVVSVRRSCSPFANTSACCKVRPVRSFD